MDYHEHRYNSVQGVVVDVLVTSGSTQRTHVVQVATVPSGHCQEPEDVTEFRATYTFQQYGWLPVKGALASEVPSNLLVPL